MKNLLILIFLSFTLTSCSSMFNRISFSDEMDEQKDPYYTADKDFQVVSGDNGHAYRSRYEILRRTPLSSDEYNKNMESYSLEKEYQSRLRKLSPIEYQEFRQYEDQLGHISQKIYALRLTPSQRSRFLHSFARSQPSPLSQYGSMESRIEYLKLRTSKKAPLFIGMSKDEVVSRWGRPDYVEVAGNPRLENEKWTFLINGKEGHVYFEQGQVQGWVNQ